MPKSTSPREVPSPREVMERYLHCTSEAKWSDAAELYDDHAVVEVPFALVRPSRLEGAESIREHLDEIAAAPMKAEPRNIVFYETTDPEVVVVEFDLVGHVSTTGRAFQVPNISVVRVRDGRIVHAKNYHNDLVPAQAAGMVEELLAAFTAKSSGEATTSPASSARSSG